MGNTFGGQKRQVRYSPEQAEKDLGPCGKLCVDMMAEPDDSRKKLEFLFGLESCLKQHLNTYTYDEEKRSRMEAMLLVFGDSGPETPFNVIDARRTAHNIDWVKKLREEAWNELAVNPSGANFSSIKMLYGNLALGI